VGEATLYACDKNGVRLEPVAGIMQSAWRLVGRAEMPKETRLPNPGILPGVPRKIRRSAIAR